MKGTFNCILLAAAGFCIQLIAREAAAFSMAETCKYHPGGFIADANACQRYGHCANRTLSFTGSCPGFLLYDRNKGMCNHNDAVECLTSPSETCKNFAGTNKIRDPNDCSRYCECQNLEANCMSCPKNQIFSPDKQKCLKKSTRPCGKESVCHLVIDGTRVADPESCDKSYLCKDGRIVSSKTCRKETPYYDPIRQNCTNNNNVCANKNPNPNLAPGVDSPLEDSNVACRGSKGNPEKPEFLPDGESCMGYFICTKDGGKGIWQKCPHNMHFHDQHCVKPSYYACPHDRCANTDKKFVTVIGTKCKNYHVCENQTTQIIPGKPEGRPCPGDTYFHEDSGTCSPGKPQNNLC